MTMALAVLASEDTTAMLRRELERDPRLRSENTRRGYLSDLTAFSVWRQGLPISKLTVERYVAELQDQKRSPNSINRALAAIRWFARRTMDAALEEDGLGKTQRTTMIDQGERVTKIADVRGERLPKGRHIQDHEVKALLKACARDKAAAGRRDAALIALAWSTGMRRAEMAGLRIEQIRLEPSATYIVTIRGKGDKLRSGYLSGEAGMLFGRWLKLRQVRQAGTVFCPIRKNGELARGQGLSTVALGQILERRRHEAQVDRVTWHDFRRTFAGNMFAAGTDPVIVQKLMGHASLTTTGNYDRRGEDVRRDAALQLKLPM